MNSITTSGRFHSRIVAAVGGLAAALLMCSGCVHHPIIVQTPAPTVIQASTPAPAEAAPSPAQPPVIVVNQPPPAPLQDSMSPQPSSQDVWIKGYWAWRDNQQQWVPGHWEVPPHPGATWIPARWEQRGSDYVFIDGYWQ
ncbi:MAG TPA: YXWGXW repeat-containing protein [Opitutaceae bacterium]|nr:YXWGXW repeat-containing protein [Opitutaceae bacterium]